MTTISYSERINLKFTLTFSTINNVEFIDDVQRLDVVTHSFLTRWYEYKIEYGTIIILNVPVSEIESVIRIVNGFND